ncbi:MAG: DUF4147 domain-containing protein [Chloroflexi bacterium]|nr:DUF4147 domain-containing protein [Chloroflexota bacterium]
MVTPMTSTSDARAIFDAALAAADSYAAVSRSLRLDGDTLVVGPHRLALPADGRIFVVGAGKASARMTRAAEAALGSRIAGGVIAVKDGHLVPTGRVEVRAAGHPLPDARSLAAGQAMLDQVSNRSARDVVLCLLSGGGSALMEALGDGLSLDDLRAVTRGIMLGGATIVELNAVRKHLSLLKGGQLARRARPARVAALILSDVVGDDLSSIASGPTTADPSTFSDALDIVRRYGLDQQPDAKAVTRYLTRGAAGELPDTPKPGDPLFDGVCNVVVGSNRLAIDAAAAHAASLGYHTEVLTTYLQGEAREAGRVLAGIARERTERRASGERWCLLAGGETTVTVRGRGRGGRNHEMALAAALALDGVPGVTMLCAATDGGDGTSDAAGAICDGETLRRARARGLRAQAMLDDNDSHAFFAALDGQVQPGPTLTNVNDVAIMLVQ